MATIRPAKSGLSVARSPVSRPESATATICPAPNRPWRCQAAVSTCMIERAASFSSCGRLAGSIQRTGCQASNLEQRRRARWRACALQQAQIATQRALARGPDDDMERPHGVSPRAIARSSGGADSLSAASNEARA